MTSDVVVLPASELKTILAALDEAAESKRDRAETCADCADQSCETCQWCLQVAETYDSLAAHLVQTTEASRAATARQPGLAQSRPVADREAGR
jgi:hypothetical protein